LAIIEITPDYPSPTTTDRLLESIRMHPDGLTVKELSEGLNRPVSMVQICLKTLIANRQVVVKQRSYGQKLAKVYIIKPTRQPVDRQFQLSAHNSYTGLTPIGLREVAGLGLTVRTIDDWEEKRSQPKLVPSQLKHLMLVYQCTLDELVAAFE
jgi:hypothetical protein